MRDAILHLADLHIGAETEPALDEAARRRLTAARDGVLKSVTQWVANPDCRVGLLVIAGDLFDRHDPRPELIGEVTAALAELARHVIVITVPGNHDEYSYARCVYRSVGWPGVLVTNPEPQVVWRGDLGGRPCAVVSAAYQAGKVAPGQKLSLPDRREVFSDGEGEGLLIGLFHATLADRFSPDFTAAERCFWLSHQEAAERGYDYLALGHFHTRRRWQLGRCVAHYPGPPLGPRIADPGSGVLSLLQVQYGSGNLQLVEKDAVVILGCAWKFHEIEVLPEATPRAIARDIRQKLSLAGKPDGGSFNVAVLKGATTQNDLVEEVRAELAKINCPCGVAAGNLEEIVPPDVEAMAAEESLVGYFVRRWQQWKTQDKPPSEKATAVLYEGLLALGWKQTRGEDRS